MCDVDIITIIIAGNVVIQAEFNGCQIVRPFIVVVCDFYGIIYKRMTIYLTIQLLLILMKE